MNMLFERKLAIPMEVKEMYPLTGRMSQDMEKQVAEMKAVFAGRDDRFILVIGPCSADAEDPMLDYASRLAKVQEKVADLGILHVRALFPAEIHRKDRGQQNHDQQRVKANVSGSVFSRFFIQTMLTS